MVAETSCRAKRGKNNALKHLALALNEIAACARLLVRNGLVNKVQFLGLSGKM